MKTRSLMGSVMASALVAIGAAQAGRVYGAANIARYIDDWGGMAGHTQRSRGPQAKPRKRSNRLTISKRVRRKHRRAR